MTVVFSDAVLFAPFGSGVELRTLASFVYVPPGVLVFAVTSSVMSHSAPGASAPRVQDAEFPLVLQEPLALDAPSSVNCDGTASETLRLVAVDGPPLWTVSVYWNDWPGSTGSAESDFVIERSADLATVSVSVEELLPGAGSDSGELKMEAVLDRLVPG